MSGRILGCIILCGFFFFSAGVYLGVSLVVSVDCVGLFLRSIGSAFGFGVDVFGFAGSCDEVVATGSWVELADINAIFLCFSLCSCIFFSLCLWMARFCSLCVSHSVVIKSFSLSCNC